MSKSKNETCFDKQYLQEYLDEQLCESDEAEVKSHISSCHDCQESLERVAADQTVWDSLREDLTLAQDPSGLANDDKRLQHLIDYLGPTENPDMLGRLGQYEVIGLIGQGSMGIVLKALEPRLNRFVAIKVLSPMISSKGAARRRFEREGRAVAAVSHQHVVPIYAVDEFRGLPYIVMQYIAGVSLSQRIDNNGPLESCEVMRISLQVANGLAAAHSQGIVHRDIKPANVILESTVERAMVTDFGLALVADEASMTRSGTIAGTPQYMSPEQAKGEVIDPRSDLFSLGSLMYAACTARAPFRADTFFGVIHRVCNTEPRPIREINPAIDEWLVEFITKLLSKRPDDRFQTANEVAEKLTAKLAYMQNPTSIERPALDWCSPPEKKKTTVKLKQSIVALLLVATLATAAAVFYPRKQPVNELAPSVGLAAKVVKDSDGKRAGASIASVVAAGGASVVWNNSTPSILEHTFEQSFPIAENGLLVLNVDQGDVLVESSNRNDQITVTAVRRIATDSLEEAESIIANHRLQLTANNNTLMVGSQMDNSVAERYPRGVFERVLYNISVPSRFNLEVVTQRGDIEVGQIVGDVSAKTVMGGIVLARIDGGVFAEATEGDIELLHGCTGEADLLTIRGDVYVANVSGTARVRTSGGDVWLGENEGKVSAHTSGGDVVVDNISGPTNARAEHGNVCVHLLRQPAVDCRFGANGGNVAIYVSDDVAVSLQARGQLATDLEFKSVKADESDLSHEPWLERKLNGGGTRIRAVSSTGTVSVRVVDSQNKSGGVSDHGAKAVLGGSGLGGSGAGSKLGGSGGLGGSGKGHRSLGGSGLSSRQQPGQSDRVLTYDRSKISGEPRPGAIATIHIPGDGLMDGYTLYLPVSHAEGEGLFPILVFLQGSYGVGGTISDISNWGLPRLIRDENDLSIERNRLLLDSFIVVSPHIREGQYYNHALLVKKIIHDVAAEYNGDLDRVYLTGLSRGGHGTWGIASRLPGTFAAIAPIGGRVDSVANFNKLAGTSIWIAHNTGDQVSPFADIANAVNTMEDGSNVEFLRIDNGDASGTDYLNNKYILTAPRVDSHDAWTDMYSSVEFYKWLLLQKSPTR
jgi:serine/threonine protein kinase/predicted esterase